MPVNLIDGSARRSADAVRGGAARGKIANGKTVEAFAYGARVVAISGNFTRPSSS